MIVKVVGLCGGLYRERTWEEVEDYIFTNSGADLADIVFEGEYDTPYSHLELIFKDKEPVEISFNSRAFVMGNNGKTIDVLTYSDRH
jgi:hypothetical protein